MTQSAISHEVRTIEEQLGTPLFRRVNRTLRLTQAGEELYRTVDEALALIDATARRLAGSRRALSVTTSVPLASLWLSPRLSGFTRRHPDIDMRVVATNDMLDLEREHIDVAIRYVPRGAAAPSADSLFDYETFPVCSPALARDRKRPLRAPADLARHVLLEHEMVRNARPWYEWDQWFAAKNIRAVRSAGLLRFSHYDQVVQAAIEGSGIAVGKRPHLGRALRDGLLVAPFGDAGVVTLGRFHVVVAGTGQTDAADAFIAWLRAEARRDEAHAGAGLPASGRPRRAKHSAIAARRGKR